ncbi:MAG: phosphate ABC transporter substrate-binding protein [Oscillospiraceae bacterium]|nr:phosphate ABC transporter substrate-binding protein [Oscillospiraceae bacterium]
MKKITVPRSWRIWLLVAVLITATLFAGYGETVSPSGGNTSNNESEGGNSTTEVLSGVVKTGGSTSVEKVMLALIYQFQEDNGDVTVDYEGNGSGDGIVNTISGLYEIGHSSRELKTDGSEDGLDVTAYAIDGIAVVVNKDNGVDNLTKEQIFGIYTGEITNWSEVGGNNAPIAVITRESGSGTRSAIADIIGLEKKDDDSTKIIDTASEANNTGAVQTQVSVNPDAIGYMSFSDVDPAKVNTVNYEGVEISENSLKDGTYKLMREFLLLTKTGSALSPAAQAFMNFVMSDNGQQIVTDNKLLPIN